MKRGKDESRNEYKRLYLFCLVRDETFFLYHVSQKDVGNGRLKMKFDLREMILDK